MTGCRMDTYVRSDKARSLAKSTTIVNTAIQISIYGTMADLQ